MQSGGYTCDAEEVSQRNPLPRNGDYAGFTGRTSHQNISPRSESQDDVWAPGNSSYEPLGIEPLPSNADVELRGITSDGGMALHVEIDDDDDDDVQEQCSAQHVGKDILLPPERQTQFEQVQTAVSSACACIFHQHNSHLSLMVHSKMSCAMLADHTHLSMY